MVSVCGIAGGPTVKLMALQAAYHEAGHAFMALDAGLVFDEITLHFLLNQTKFFGLG